MATWPLVVSHPCGNVRSVRPCCLAWLKLTAPVDRFAAVDAVASLFLLSSPRVASTTPPTISSRTTMMARGPHRRRLLLRGPSASAILGNMGSPSVGRGGQRPGTLNGSFARTEVRLDDERIGEHVDRRA